jgi:hypothetical protein
MKPIAFVLCLVTAAANAPAKHRQTVIIEIQVVDAQTSKRYYTYSMPGTAAESTTNCDTSATATDLGGTVTANGTTNCTTTTTPGRPPQTVVGSIPQVHVRAIMPDGRHVTMWCQQKFRRCSALNAGTYAAEVRGNAVWIHGHDLDGTERRVKYLYVGGW